MTQDERFELSAPILTDQDVRERMNWLTANGFPGTETVQRAKEFVKYARGPVAEGAVRELAPRLPEESLNELVREYVLKHSDDHTDFCGSAPNLVAIDLAERPGFEVVQGPRWRVETPSGEDLIGDELCRLALLGVWLNTMQSDPDES